MREPTEDRWADARRVLARRTPDSIVTINQGGIDVRTGRDLRSVLCLTVAHRPDDIQGDWDQDALSLAWNVLPDLLAERDRCRAALPPPCPIHGDGFMARGAECWYCAYGDEQTACDFCAPISPESLEVLRGGPAPEGGDGDAR